MSNLDFKFNLSVLGLKINQCQTERSTTHHWLVQNGLLTRPWVIALFFFRSIKKQHGISHSLSACSCISNSACTEISSKTHVLTKMGPFKKPLRFLLVFQFHLISSLQTLGFQHSRSHSVHLALTLPLFLSLSPSS